MEAARLALAPQDEGTLDRWTLLAGDWLAATVRLEGGQVAVWADADPEALTPGQARRLALALLDHADKAEKVS